MATPRARMSTSEGENLCAQRWHTREGTCQLKRRRLLPDMRDPPSSSGHERHQIINGWHGHTIRGRETVSTMIQCVTTAVYRASNIRYHEEISTFSSFSVNFVPYSHSNTVSGSVQVDGWEMLFERFKLSGLENWNLRERSVQWPTKLQRVARSLWDVLRWRCAVRVFLPPGVKDSWSPCLMAHLREVACNACLLISMERAWGQTHIKMLLSPYMFATLLLGNTLLSFLGFQCMDTV